MKNLIFLLFAVFPFENVISTPVRECDGIPAPLNVDIKNCAAPPCLLPQNADAIMDVTFNVPTYSNAFSPKVWATVAGVTTPYPLNPDGCSNLVNGACPITPGEVLLFNFRMPISSSYPQVSVDLEFRLVGDNNVNLTCFKVAARVVPPT